jgi:hypothetical protein
MKTGIQSFDIVDTQLAADQSIMNYANGEGVSEIVQNIVELGKGGMISVFDARAINGVQGFDKFSGRKLMFANPDSFGKDSMQMKELLNMNSTTKSSGHGAKNNHGAGMKKAGLKDSPAGLMVITKFQDDPDAYISILCQNEEGFYGIAEISDDQYNKTVHIIEAHEVKRLLRDGECLATHHLLEQYESQKSKGTEQAEYVPEKFGVTGYLSDKEQFTVVMMMGEKDSHDFLHKSPGRGSSTLEKIIRVNAPKNVNSNNDGKTDIFSYLAQKFCTLDNNIHCSLSTKEPFPRKQTMKGIDDLTHDCKSVEWTQTTTFGDAKIRLVFGAIDDEPNKLADKGIKKMCGFLSGIRYRGQIIPSFSPNQWQTYAPKIHVYSKIAFIQLTVELVDDKWIHSADRTEMITGRQKKETFSFSDLMTDLGNNYEDFPEEAKRLIKERHQEESTLEDVKKDILDKFHSNDTGNSSKKSNKNKKNKQTEIIFNGKNPRTGKTAAPDTFVPVNVPVKRKGAFINDNPLILCDGDLAKAHKLDENILIAWNDPSRQIFASQNQKPIMDFCEDVIGDIDVEDREKAREFVFSNCLVAAATYIATYANDEKFFSEQGASEAINSTSISTNLRTHFDILRTKVKSKKKEFK